MFPLAIYCFVVGLFVFALWGVSSVTPPSIGLPDWMAGVGVSLMLAGVVLALFALSIWVGWRVPGWLIWLTGIVGVLVLAVSWVGTLGDPLGRSPIESYPFLVIIGSGVLAAAVVAGFAY